MRLFIGVTIDADVVARMSESIDELRERVVNSAPRARVRWVAADQLHVTVRFIGEASETQTANIATALGAALPQERFELAFRGLGVFP
jgi:2'-5' RNA ligase